MIQFFQQRFRFFEIRRSKAFSEPAIDLSDQLSRFLRLTLLLPQPRQAHGLR